MNAKHGIALAALLAAFAPHGAQAKATAQAAKVIIERDEWGIAHISGATDADAVYGMIYAQAQDDFPRIEQNYLVSLGRLAEAEGEAALWQDLRQRLFIDPARLKADYARSPVWLRALMTAWAAGLNAYLTDHPEVRPRVITRFEPWMALSFTEGSIGGDIERVPLSQLEAFYGKRTVAMTADERGLIMREPLGSNGIAIAPSHTADGKALLLINPHTSFFFRAEQQVTSREGLNAYGAATWGQFFIYQGFNANAGWMHTSSGVDNVDEFAETLDAGPDGKPGYRYGDKVRTLRKTAITLKVRQADGSQASRTFTTYASHHGPIVREEGGKWIAFALMNRPIAALEQSFLRTKTRDLASFLKVAALQANSSNDTLFADSKGNTAYLHPQFVPIRDPRFNWQAPVDGSDPEAEWKGLHTIASLPNVINPANGWVFNVNDAPWNAAGPDSPRAADYPAYMDEAGTNARTPHAKTVLGARRDFTLDRLLGAAYDPALPAFDRLLPALIAAHEAAPDPAHDAPVALLKGWDRRWSLNSTATTLAITWAETLWANVAEDAAKANVPVYDWMATRASDTQRLAALGEAAAKLKADFGDWQVPWGEINRYQRNDSAIKQTFNDARPSTPIPFTSAQWGSLAAFGASRYPGTKRTYGTYGNSFVAVVEFGPRVKARAISIGGENSDPASPHFADQVDRYARGDLRPVHFYPDELAGHITSRQELVRRR